MRLSDLVEHTAIASSMAQAGLIVALVGFVAMIVYVLARRNRATFERARMMPLCDDQPVLSNGTDGDDGDS